MTPGQQEAVAQMKRRGIRRDQWGRPVLGDAPAQGPTDAPGPVQPAAEGPSKVVGANSKLLTLSFVILAGLAIFVVPKALGFGDASDDPTGDGDMGPDNHDDFEPEDQLEDYDDADDEEDAEYEELPKSRVLRGGRR
jgi:hypothetical protein